MITGKVQAKVDKDGLTYLKPQIIVSVAGLEGVSLNLDAIVDTGFTGWLALPEDIIEELRLTLYGRRPANQASGVGMFSIYGALVTWHGELRPVLAHQLTGNPLVGMGLLECSRLTVEAREGGDVVIEEMPRQ